MGTAHEKTAALIVAAGQGQRAGGDVPKQWQLLGGQNVVDRTVRIFTDHPAIDVVALVVSPSDRQRIEGHAFPQTLILATGGASRSASVVNGLEALADQGIKTVLIHDVARTTIPSGVIDRVLQGCKDFGAAAPALAVTDALWVSDGTRIDGTRARDGLFRAQTPQGFAYDAIRAAHARFEGDAADDVEVARAAGIEVALVAGDEDNLKITYPGDFKRAERILEKDMDVRCGNGFDVHAFGPGDHVILCGERIAHDQGLVGHSDADVGMHALTDALYGAMGEGDIGRHFPPSDPQWKGAASEIFLAHARDLAKSRGFAITNVDVTLVCEFPKIGPHAAAMITQIARILKLDPTRVSIKATTSERLGFTGRGEGIAALATATLVAK